MKSAREQEKESLQNGIETVKFFFSQSVPCWLNQKLVIKIKFLKRMRVDGFFTYQMKPNSGIGEQWPPACLHVSLKTPTTHHITLQRHFSPSAFMG